MEWLVALLPCILFVAVAVVRGEAAPAQGAALVAPARGDGLARDAEASAAEQNAGAIIDSLARKTDFRGVVRLERDGRLVVERHYGIAADTAFWVASITKSLTATLILALEEESKLRLDDPIVRFFPRAPADARDIRIDELLTHPSGLPRATYEAEGISEVDEAAGRILALPRGPRGRFAYTNDGYVLLAIIAEKAGGAPFFDQLRRRIVERAGMTSTGFWPACAPGVPVAKLTRSPAGARAVENWGFKGAEGVCSTAADLARFIDALASGKLVGRAAVDRLWADVVATSGGFAGRGFFTSAIHGSERVVWTRGTEDYGHNGVVQWLPQRRLTVVVLSDVPEPRRDVPAPSRALGDLIDDEVSRLAP